MPDPLSTTAEFTAERREVVTTPGGLVLTVHRPASGAARGSVLLIPGWSGPRSGPADLLAWLAQRIAATGWTAVRMDLPGRGDSRGNFADVDLDDMIESARGVAALFQSAGPGFLLGVCSGGNVALGASSVRNPPSSHAEAQRRGEHLEMKSETASADSASLRENHPQSALRNGVIALSVLPFQPARSNEFEHRRRWKNLKNYASKALSPATWSRLLHGEINLGRVRKNVTTSETSVAGDRNLKDSARDIERELLEWQGPALFVWGGGDEEAPPARAHFEKLHAAGMGSREHTVFHTVGGANHNFYAQAWREELCKLILAFLAENH